MMMPQMEPLIDRNGVPPQPSANGSASRRIENLQNLNYQHLLYFWTVARDGSIADACDRLQLSQPTISMQIGKLEKSLGHKLFDRSGRKLVLTEIGRTVYDYADEIFSLGRELLGTLRGLPGKRSGRLHVGIPTFLPKLITYRLLEPVIHLRQEVQVVCHEDDMADLVAELARHRFDVILTDTPIQSAAGVRTFNHPLGKCDIAICGAPILAARYRARFPESLDGAPFLLPTGATYVRQSLDCWFDDIGVQPRIVGEFDDSALMKEFGKGGAGLFIMPSAVLPEVTEQFQVELVGRVPNLAIRYYAVTTERKLTHPATILIAETAKAGLLSDPDT